ncbi:flagellar biosynthesis anti-sigma factor FlgM [Chromobacterium subtsugae]|uniref:Negative regulator of flagellin synthesis n=1 Tax=Chromobacterium subtsugae TaxID=251747 RepID=A0ABS7FCQ5_9NEIS|nr:MULTISPECIES: flagellar biosynthesis anti-sigma factor FlgM [Chromobacterium]KUM04652.1 flagellar biosynthesis anti-sigma factor FlgM [Chromobacterium subtsugae]KZE85765.1 flagellar biosynthesis anti-sigma factor FlgM [Chromobacterium sp. F49]MBW7566400.1 flagellar biosynthesis anti-sigma factor FlgM [Chromobacterium subtsugae]MBW8287741.1 flagellar biosynthesis anti-sigma factor FlgM [Chromobacterium subtsugae]OBU85567.1 flagellar biosynthesis anti-sigma factor FlgM [Chromobacterium subtsu
MKIDNSGKLSGTYSTQSKTTARAPSSSTSSQGSSSDSVQINSVASRLSAIGNDPSQQPAFDAAKVESIKSAIANGSFSINPDKIADGLISSAQELLQG